MWHNLTSRFPNSFGKDSVETSISIKKRLIFIVSILLVMMQGFAQCDYTPNQSTVTIGSGTNCPEFTGLQTNNTTIYASDKVTLAAGFSFNNTTSHTLTIKTDNLNLVANYVVPNAPVTPSFSTSDIYIPGTIQGSVDVSPTGAATYSIPIVVSPGSHGVQPQLSINYSGQSGHGEFGWGWHLGGLSSIRIVGQNMYDDGRNVSPRTVSSNAIISFDLDGQRLIPTGVTDRYTLQNNPYCSITGNQLAGFIVTMPDGSISEYGIDDDAFSAYEYRINKTTDADGNYFQYQYYLKDNINDYRIIAIDYTGNGSKEPTNSIRFNYAQTTETNTMYQYADQGPLQNNCITSISIMADNVVSKQYSFNYFFDNGYTKLNRITLVDEGKSYNPTFINWGTAPDFSFQNATYNYNTSNASVSNLGSAGGSHFYTGDVDGDGQTDLVYLSISGATWNLNTILGGSSANFPKGFTNIEGINLLDWNNDGKDELLVHSYSNTIHYIDCYVFNGTNWVIDTQTPQSTYSGSNFSFYYSDINSDGIVDRVVVKNGMIINFENKNGNVKTAGSNSDYGLNFPDTQNGGYNTNANVDDIKFLDFDGDGQMEMLVHCAATSSSKSKYYIVHQNLDTYDFTVEWNDYYAQWTALPQNIFLGDFNGDGRTDILEYETSGWRVFYSAENTIVQGSLPSGFPNVQPSYSNFIGPLASICTDDINGDGKADIIYAFNGNQYNSMWTYLSNGKGFYCAGKKDGLPNGSNNLSVSTAQLNFSCLNNTQTAEPKRILYGSDYPYYIFSFPSLLNAAGNITSVTDGNNTTTSFTYAYVSTATNPTAAQPTTALCSLFPISYKIIKDPLFVTTRVNTNALSTLSNSIGYTYTDALYYPYKGFLGFTTFQKTTTYSPTGNLTIATDKTTFTPTINYGSNSFVSPFASKNVTSRGSTVSITTNTYLNAYKVDVGKRQFVAIPYKQDITNTATGFTTYINNTFSEDIGKISTVGTSTGTWSSSTTTTYDHVSGSIYRPRSTSYTKTLSSQTPYSTSTAYSYENTLYPLRVTKTVAGNKTTQITSFDGYGNPTAVSITAGADLRTSSTTYDAAGRFAIANIDALGYTSSATYRSGDGAVLTKIDQNGLVTTFSYSRGSNRYIVTINPPSNNTATNVLAWSSMVGFEGLYFTKSSVLNGNGVNKVYDGLGLLLKEVTLGHNGTQLITTKTYFNDGSLATTTDAAGNTITYGYDDAGRILTEYEPDVVDNIYDYATPNAVNVTSTIDDGHGEFSTTKTTDAMGNVTNISGTNGTIDYSYYSNGKVKDITANGVTDSMRYDPVTLDQLKLIDRDAGTTTYTYNGFGQLLTQKDAKNQTITCSYDGGGRLLTKTGPFSVSNVYSTTLGQLGLLASTTRDGITESYTYNALYRTTAITTSGGAVSPGGQVGTYTSSYSYNRINQLASTTYPTGLTVNYAYDNVGYLTGITNTAGVAIWTGGSTNNLDQWTSFSQNNNSIPTTIGYDANTHLPTSIQTGTAGSILNLSYSYIVPGQMMSRSDLRLGLSEAFTYDSQNRLTQDWVGGTDPTRKHIYSYLTNGNIDSSSIVGKYNYTAAQPHAVTAVLGIPLYTGHTKEPGLLCNSSYNAENKIATIDNGMYHDDFTYGIDGNRYRVDFKTSGVLKSSKVYIGSSEFGYSSTGVLIYTRTFIKAPTGVCAVYQDSCGVKAFYFIHCDSQGSWLAISNTNGTVVNRYSYDAWGRPRNVADWTLKAINVGSELTNLNAFQPRFDRGYTGHEIMAGFGLINMNGRLYDPYLQRFLSPDPTVQAPSNAQSYNRYSYCMNNPLMYTDPSGYNFKDWWHKHGNQVASTIVAVGVGVAVGIATAGIGDIVIAGFVTGFAAGGASGLTGAVLNKQSVDGCLSAMICGAMVGGYTGIATNVALAGIGYGFSQMNGVKVMSSNMAGGGFTMGGFRLTSAGYIQLGNGAVSGASNGAIGGATNGIAAGLSSLATGAFGPSMAGGSGGYFSGAFSSTNTITNHSGSDVWYLLDDNSNGGTIGVVHSGGTYNGRIDGIATKAYNNMVFKVPSNNYFEGSVTIGSDGSVDLDAYGLGDLMNATGFHAGWKSISDFNNWDLTQNGWQKLFDAALLIKK